MPLPTAGQVWPPKQLAPITAKQAEFDAWYAGDSSRLQQVYAARTATGRLDRAAQHRGGVAGTLARMWWGRPAGAINQQADLDKLHVPIASDLCQASADLLFAEPPSISSSDKTAQEELDKALEAGLMTRLAEGAEVGAALGDVYYRVGWDTAFADRSFITPVHADAAVPEFRWGHLVAVTFWWVLSSENQTVVRHLERHELDGRNGVVFHGLYEGTTSNLGQQVPLTEHPSTKGITVNADGYIPDGITEGLAVVHIPNQTPQRRWRSHPVGAHLGRSDLDGLEEHMDKLDMVYSSWMRDVRLAKGRLIVPTFMLETLGPGTGASFDTDQDIFTTVNAPPREDGATQIVAQQFAIRVDEHQRTAQQLVDNILRTAGYSQQTFGEGNDVAITATEVTSKDRRSALTRDRKIRGLQPAIARILRKKLAVDAEVFKTGVGEVNVTVEFVDVTQADPLQLAQTNQALFQAQAASARTRVQIQHPDWDEKAIDAEAAAVLAEFGAVVPDPASFRPGVDDQGSAGPADVDSGDAGQS